MGLEKSDIIVSTMSNWKLNLRDLATFLIFTSEHLSFTRSQVSCTLIYLVLSLFFLVLTLYIPFTVESPILEEFTKGYETEAKTNIYNFLVF